MTTSKIILLSYLASMNRHTFSVYEKCQLYLLLAVGIMAKELVGKEEGEGETLWFFLLKPWPNSFFYNMQGCLYTCYTV